MCQILQDRSNAIVAQDSGESVKQVQRYVRLTELVPPLLQMVDDKKIPIMFLYYVKRNGMVLKWSV